MNVDNIKINEEPIKENNNNTFEYINKDTGEEYKATATADWFPEVSAEYSTTELTQNSVDLVIHFNKDGEELQLENNLNVATSKYPETIGYYIEKKEGALNTYTIKHNITITLMFKYQGQRLLSLPVSVTNIDEVEPVGTIKYSNTEPTYRNVTATIEFNKPNVKILNNEGKDTFRFEENGSFTFEYEDEVGRRRTSTANVDWIDKIAPIAKIEYSTVKKTKNPVTATIKEFSEEATIINNGGKNTYTFTSNGSFTFEIQDEAGNIGKIVAKVNWIDDNAVIIPPRPTTTTTKKTTTKKTTSQKTTNKIDVTNTTNNAGGTNTTNKTTNSSKKTTTKGQNSTTSSSSKTTSNAITTSRVIVETNEEEEKKSKNKIWLYIILGIILVILLILFCIARKKQK